MECYGSKRKALETTGGWVFCTNTAGLTRKSFDPQDCQPGFRSFTSSPSSIILPKVASPSSSSSLPETARITRLIANADEGGLRARLLEAFQDLFIFSFVVLFEETWFLLFFFPRPFGCPLAKANTFEYMF